LLDDPHKSGTERREKECKKNHGDSAEIFLAFSLMMITSEAMQMNLVLRYAE
jgi:hypothetical protein